MAAHARLKNVFTVDEKYHNLMRWLINFCVLINVVSFTNYRATLVVVSSHSTEIPLRILTMSVIMKLFDNTTPVLMKPTSNELYSTCLLKWLLPLIKICHVLNYSTLDEFRIYVIADI